MSLGGRGGGIRTRNPNKRAAADARIRRSGRWELHYVINGNISVDWIKYTECPTRYRTRHFFNNSNTNEDIATKFEQEYVLFFHISYTMRQARFKFCCNILISGEIIIEMPGSVVSGTLCVI